MKSNNVIQGNHGFQVSSVLGTYMTVTFTNNLIIWN